MLQFGYGCATIWLWLHWPFLCHWLDVLCVNTSKCVYIEYVYMWLLYSCINHVCMHVFLLSSVYACNGDIYVNMVICGICSCGRV